MMDYPGMTLSGLLEEASFLWRGCVQEQKLIAHKALSQVLRIVPEAEVQYVSLDFDKQNEAKFRMHVFGPGLLLCVTSEGNDQKTVETTITPRARLSNLRLLSTPITTTGSPMSGARLTLELQYPGETLTLTNHGVSNPERRARLDALLPSLLIDLAAHS